MDAGLKAILDILRARVGHDFRCYKPGTLDTPDPPEDDPGQDRDHGRLRPAPDRSPRRSRPAAEGPAHRRHGLLPPAPGLGNPGKQVIAPLVENAPRVRKSGSGSPAARRARRSTAWPCCWPRQVEKSGGKTNFQIFATDADFAALATARTGSYPAEEIGANVSAERLKRFFSRKDGRYQVIKNIRERIVFAAQNLTADPPFSRLDLISCRNLLIYLDQEVQRKIIALFHFALREGGFLFLGNAETIGDRGGTVRAGLEEMADLPPHRRRASHQCGNSGPVRRRTQPAPFKATGIGRDAPGPA